MTIKRLFQLHVRMLVTCVLVVSFSSEQYAHAMLNRLPKKTIIAVITGGYFVGYALNSGDFLRHFQHKEKNNRVIEKVKEKKPPVENIKNSKTPPAVQEALKEIQSLKQAEDVWLANSQDACPEHALLVRQALRSFGYENADTIPVKKLDPKIMGEEASDTLSRETDKAIFMKDELKNDPMAHFLAVECAESFVSKRRQKFDEAYLFAAKEYLADDTSRKQDNATRCRVYMDTTFRLHKEDNNNRTIDMLGKTEDGKKTLRELFTRCQQQRKSESVPFKVEPIACSKIVKLNLY